MSRAPIPAIQSIRDDDANFLEALSRKRWRDVLLPLAARQAQQIRGGVLTGRDSYRRSIFLGPPLKTTALWHTLPEVPQTSRKGGGAYRPGGPYRPRAGVGEVHMSLHERR